MARKPNFNFERQQRDKAKAEKKAEKAEAKIARKRDDKPAGEAAEGTDRPTE